MKAIIIQLIDNTSPLKPQHTSLLEAEELLYTFGIKDVTTITQNASRRDPATYIGTGKLDEIIQLCQAQNMTHLIVNANLPTGQLYTITSKVTSQLPHMKVWDRITLILKIFKKHASTAEAKLQINLAELQHQGPQLSGIGASLSQQAGGIGTRGIGETQSERMRRHWQQEIKSTQIKLDKLLSTKKQQMKHRKRTGIPTISIVGYTNAGKTTLFNALSDKQDATKDALFATLDSSVSHVYIPKLGREVFITDTIGFIQDLPVELVDAFKSTLLETTQSDIILHVIDASDSAFQHKIDTVNQIIRQVIPKDTPVIHVFNKIDKVSASQRSHIKTAVQGLKPIWISAKKEHIKPLINRLTQELQKMGLTKPGYLQY